jgi:integrase
VLGGVEPHLMVTDPPYGVNYDPAWRNQAGREYLDAAGLRGEGKGPLFRSAIGKIGALTDKPMSRVDAYRMVRRRTADAGFKNRLGCHVFRATGITAYLERGGTLENAQAMAAHESPRTTKLYDRTGDQITLDEVEKIQI